MSRILNRPMFRLGGSTSGGITSGLDTPKRGRVDGPGGYAGLGKLDPEEAMRITETITDKYYPQRGADLSRFLINFGLNMGVMHRAEILYRPQPSKHNNQPQIFIPIWIDPD